MTIHLFSICVGIVIFIVCLAVGLWGFRAAEQKAIRKSAQQQYDRLSAAFHVGFCAGYQAARKHSYREENKDEQKTDS